MKKRKNRVAVTMNGRRVIVECLRIGFKNKYKYRPFHEQLENIKSIMRQSELMACLGEPYYHESIDFLEKIQQEICNSLSTKGLTK